MSNGDTEVLVTGASGFVGSHCVKALLDAGFRVRGSVRSTKNAAKIDPILAINPQAVADGRFTLVEADLLDAESWKRAVAGCSLVLHVASPFPLEQPKDENELIRPAVDGTLNVLRAAAAANIKRVVLTSSVAAVYGGNQHKRMTEEDWTDVTDVLAYEKSKTLAEREAWNFIGNLPDTAGSKLELATLCPPFIVGPMLHNVECASAQLIKRMLTGGFPMVPQLALETIDVRDLALAQVRALTLPQAANQRIIVSSAGPYGLVQLAHDLSEEFKQKGYKISTTKAPYFILWLGSIFDKTIKAALPMVGKPFNTDNTKMKKVLQLTEPIASKKSCIDMAYSLIERGLVAKSSKYTPQQQHT